MNLHRRKFLHLAMGTVLPLSLSETALALDYPTRPLHMVVGFLLVSRPTSVRAFWDSGYRSV